jgi:hypothetical protein
VITDAYPFIPRCWMGKADKSFQKKAGIDEGPEKKPPASNGSNKAPKIDMRKYGMVARDPVSACAGRRSGNFCSYRGRDLVTVQGTCRGVRAQLLCQRIDR